MKLKPIRSLLAQVSLVAVCLPIAVTSHAVETLGKQTPELQFDAPLLETPQPEKLEIDFDSLLDTTTAYDDQRVTHRLNKLIIQFSYAAGQPTESDNPFIQLVGQTKISDPNIALYQALSNSLKSYQDKPLTFGDIRLIRQDIVTLYRQLGYPLMTVVVPPQEIIDGQLRLQILEFQLGKLDYQWQQEDGSYVAKTDAWTSEQNLNETFAQVKSAPVLSQKQLDQAVNYLKANPFRQVNAVFEKGDQPEQSDIKLLITEKRPWNANISYNNFATKETGTHRYSVGATLGNVPYEDDQLGLLATFGNSAKEFQSFSVRYKVPTRRGHSFLLNTNVTDTYTETNDVVASSSKTTQAIANYEVPYQVGGNPLVSKAVLSFRSFERGSYFVGTKTASAAFDSVEIGIAESYSWQDQFASNKFDANWMVSLKGLNNKNSNSEFQTFHNNTASAEYSFLVLNYARQYALDQFDWHGYDTTTQLSWQIAPSVTAGADNFSIGGSSVLKAYPAGESSGDEGWYVTQTLNYPAWSGGQDSWLKQARFSNYIEAGSAGAKGSKEKSLWDLGMAFNINMSAQGACNVSVAVAGEKTLTTKPGDVKGFVSCSMTF